MELNNKSYLSNDSFSDIINKEFISVFPNKDFDKKKTINSSQLLINVKAEESDFKHQWKEGKNWNENEISNLIEVIADENIAFVNENLKTNDLNRTSITQVSEEEDAFVDDFNGPTSSFTIQTPDPFTRKHQEHKGTPPERCEQVMIQIQHFLTELENESINEITDFILKSTFMTSKNKFKLLLSEIVYVSTIRLNKVPILLRLLISLINNWKSPISEVYLEEEEYEEEYDQPGFSISKVLTKFLLYPKGLDGWDFIDEVPNLYFLRQCLLFDIVSSQGVVETYSKFYNKYPNKKNHHFFVFCYFAPEIEIHNKELSEKVFRNIDRVCWFGSHVISSVMQEFYGLMKKNWKKMRDLTESGFFPDCLEKHVFVDDLESFQKTYYSEACILEQKCSKQIMCPIKWRNNSMSFLQWAALCGSEKIYFHLRKMTTRIVDISPYAIAGGNPNIIKDASLDGTSLKTALNAAAEFRRNQIFDDLIKYCKDSDLNETLCFCSRSNYFRGLVYCVTSRADLNHKSTSNKDRTALHEAAFKGYSEVVNFLLTNNGIDINARDSVVLN